MNRWKKTGLMVLAGAASAWLCMTALAVDLGDGVDASYFSDWLRDSSRDDDEEADEAGADRQWVKDNGDQDPSGGPGAGAAREDKGDAPLAGPVVREVTLGETYHEEYGLYEESLAGKYFLFVTVANGGITDQPVTLDIPAGVSYSAEKDGVAIDYMSGQALSAKGTYVIRLMAVNDSTAPLSRQEEYRAVFRFRIDEKRKAQGEGDVRSGLTQAIGDIAGGNIGLPSGYVESFEDEAALGLQGLKDAAGNIVGGLAGERDGNENDDGLGKAAGGQDTDDRNGAGQSTDGRNGAGQGADGQNGAGQSAAGQNGAGQGADGQNGAGQGADGRNGASQGADSRNGAGQGADSRNGAGQSADSQNGAGQGADGQSAAAQAAAANTASRRQVYMEESSMYQVTMENGFTFLSSVPEGMIKDQSVTLELPEGEDFKLYLGEEETTPDEKGMLREYGAYRLETEGYVFAFEISNGYKNMDGFTAPVGFRIQKASFGGRSLDTGDGSYLAMEEDGAYEISLKGEAGEAYTVKLTRDTGSPVVEVLMGKQKADIVYGSDDMASVTLSRNKGEPSPFAGVMVDSPGSYVLTATDRAGNQTVKEFTIRYHMNAFAVCAVLAVAAGGGAAAVILIRKKRNLTVR